MQPLSSGQPSTLPALPDFAWWFQHIQIVYWIVGMIVGIVTASIAYLNWRAAKRESKLKKKRDEEIANSIHSERLQVLKERVTYLESSVGALRETNKANRKIQWAIWLFFVLMLASSIWYERFVTRELQNAITRANAAQETVKQVLQRPLATTTTGPKAGSKKVSAKHGQPPAANSLDSKP
jgi:hypothetical protein